MILIYIKICKLWGCGIKFKFLGMVSCQPTFLILFLPGYALLLPMPFHHYRTIPFAALSSWNVPLTWNFLIPVIKFWTVAQFKFHLFVKCFFIFPVRFLLHYFIWKIEKSSGLRKNKSLALCFFNNAMSTLRTSPLCLVLYI